MENNHPKSSFPWHKLLSLTEAAEIWSLDESTVRKAIAAGRLVEGIDCRKFGKQWIINSDAMDRTFKRSSKPPIDHKKQEREQTRKRLIKFSTQL